MAQSGLLMTQKSSHQLKEKLTQSKKALKGENNFYRKLHTSVDKIYGEKSKEFLAKNLVDVSNMAASNEPIRKKVER